jgi:amino acid permease
MSQAERDEIEYPETSAGMEFTPEESKFVRPYLEMEPSPGRGWLVGVVVGILIIIGGVLVPIFTEVDYSGALVVLLVIVGMVVIDIALDWRRKKLTAQVLQKYHRAVRRLYREIGEEETI